jgi:hypothetical protein
MLSEAKHPYSCRDPRGINIQAALLRDVLLVLLAIPALLFAAPESLPSPAASMQRKLDYLEKNAAQSKPDPAPTQFSEQEVNAYVASGAVKLPRGVRSLRLMGSIGVITAYAKINFDEITAGRPSNPLLRLFSGMHDVMVVAHSRGLHGEGLVDVDSVSIDDIEVPRFALQLFVEKYLQPKYPNLGLHSHFALPERIDTATVGSHRLIVTQK